MARVDHHRSKVSEGERKREENREKNRYEGGKRWNLLELSGAYMHVVMREAMDMRL